MASKQSDANLCLPLINSRCLLTLQLSLRRFVHPLPAQLAGKLAGKAASKFAGRLQARVARGAVANCVRSDCEQMSGKRRSIHKAADARLLRNSFATRDRDSTKPETTKAFDFRAFACRTFNSALLGSRLLASRAKSASVLESAFDS